MATRRTPTALGDSRDSRSPRSRTLAAGVLIVGATTVGAIGVVRDRTAAPTSATGVGARSARADAAAASAHTIGEESDPANAPRSASCPTPADPRRRAASPDPAPVTPPSGQPLKTWSG